MVTERLREGEREVERQITNKQSLYKPLTSNQQIFYFNTNL